VFLVAVLVLGGLLAARRSGRAIQDRSRPEEGGFDAMVAK
jgi:hypothetical protein